MISIRYYYKSSPKLILHIPVNLLLSIFMVVKCLAVLKSVKNSLVIGMLHISTNKMVLHKLFAGQNHLISFLNKYDLNKR